MMRAAGMDPDAWRGEHFGARPSQAEQWLSLPEQALGSDGLER